MKKFKLPTAAAICLLFSLFTPTTKAQTDTSNCGIVVDGVKINQLECWSFSDMQAVFPIQEDYSNFDYIEFRVAVLKDGSRPKYYSTLVVGFTKKTFISDLSGNEYLALPVFKDKSLISCRKQQNGYGGYNYDVPIGCDASGAIFGGGTIERADFRSTKVDTKVEDPSKPNAHLGVFYLEVLGWNIQSAEKHFDNRNVLVQKLNYSSKSVLYSKKAVSFPLCVQYFKIKMSGDPKDVQDNCKPIDMNQSCTMSGKKIDLKIESQNYRTDIGVIKKIGNNTNKTELKTSVSTKTTATTKTTGSNTTTKTDPNLVPYVEKHENGKVSVQGQKDKDENPQGTWKYYDESGKLTKTEVYKDGELISTKEN